MPAVEPSTQPREVRLLPAEQPSLQQPGRAPRGVAVLPLQLLACRQRLPPELSRRHSPGTERRRRKLRVTELPFCRQQGTWPGVTRPEAMQAAGNRAPTHGSSSCGCSGSRLPPFLSQSSSCTSPGPSSAGQEEPPTSPHAAGEGPRAIATLLTSVTHGGLGSAPLLSPLPLQLLMLQV